MKLTINNQTLNLKKIGKGAFSAIYENVDNTNEVYAIVKTSSSYDLCDMSKEAIADWAEGDHVPDITKVAYDIYVSGFGRCDIYTMPKYQKLQPGTKANDIANKLIKIYKSITDQAGFYNMCVNNSWYQVSYKIIDAINECDDIPESVKESIESIVSACSDYGDHYMVEFFKRNMMTDDNGNLILLDIAFNVKALRANRK